MIVTRRALLGAAAAMSVPGLAATLVSPVSVRLVRPGKRDHAAAIEAIVAAAQASLAAAGLPGMALSLRGADGFAADLTLGWANLTTRTPVGPDHLFEIGSISKSLVALTLWKLAGAGKLDLAAPASRYLPADVLPPEPITVQQILNHTAGLPNFAPVSPVGGLWTGKQPGSEFYYSNTGYVLAGLLISAVTGRPHADAIRDEVLAPIGMTRALAHIRNADRARFATGYAPAREDATPMYGSALQEGPWTQEDIGAGAVVATVGDFGAYLDYVLALGAGRGGPILSDAAARAMLSKQNTVADPPGEYANGFMLVKIDGRPVLHHTGGMLMFTSCFDADPAAGVGAFASVNGQMGEYRPKAVTAYAVQVLRAVAAGRPIPALPDARAVRRIATPDRYVGEWRAADGGVLSIGRGDLGLVVTVGGRTARLESIGGALGTDLPGWETLPFEFSASTGKTGPLDRLWIGDRLFGRGAVPPAPRPVPERLQGLAGEYRPADPWAAAMTVVARDGELVLVGAGPLAEDARGFWRLAEDKGALERIRFDTVIGGRARRMWFSGVALDRIA